MGANLMRRHLRAGHECLVDPENRIVRQARRRLRRGSLEGAGAVDEGVPANVTQAALNAGSSSRDLSEFQDKVQSAQRKAVRRHHEKVGTSE